MHVAERRDIIEGDETFDHTDPMIFLFQRREGEGRETLLQQGTSFSALTRLFRG